MQGFAGYVRLDFAAVELALCSGIGSKRGRYGWYNYLPTLQSNYNKTYYTLSISFSPIMTSDGCEICHTL